MSTHPILTARIDLPFLFISKNYCDYNVKEGWYWGLTSSPDAGAESLGGEVKRIANRLNGQTNNVMSINPHPPFLLRAANGLGRLLPRASLDPDTLIDRACRKTGLSDFGPDGPFREALGVLCDSLETEANLTPVGRLLVRQMVQEGLENQLQVQEWYRRYPEIADQRVDNQLIIIGMPRTGTTILHELMALDPANRCPLTWEVAHPFPPPETATYDSDPRIRETARELKLSHYIMPGVENLHRMGEQLPQECVAITAWMFTSMQYNTVLRLPHYTEWLMNKADHAAMYRFHRRVLRYLQWRCPAQRWVTKTPAHLWSLEALLAEYPDAMLVQTHRDPLKIVSSLTSMLPTLRAAYAGDIDLPELAREWSDNCADALNASVASRRAGAIKSGQVIDIQFKNFMDGPAAEVERIYQHFDLDFTEEFARAIEIYIDNNPADKHGGHKHHFSDTGLDIASERDKVRDYQDYFGVISEVQTLKE